MIEALPGSTLPEKMREAGYSLRWEDEGERILPSAITDMVLTEASTTPIKMVHAGITAVERYSFTL
jgi:DNA-binding transcriptional regulator of glucitol operon